MSSVGEGEAQLTHVPVNVLLLLQPLDVQVRYCHGESVIESYSAQTQLDAECRHAAHVLGDGDTIRVERVQQFVGQHEVYHSIFIHTRAKVLVVAAAEASADTVVLVEHARNSVETETVELILLHPETQIGEQESHDLVVPVVKEPTIPQFVSSACAFVEVEVIAVVKHVKTVKDVLAGMRVHHVQQYGNTHAVCGVNQLLEVIWVAVAGRGCKEGVDLVAKGCVVCVLHDGHELDCVVSQIANAWEGILGELLVCSDLGIGTRDTDVGFVHTSGERLWWTSILELVCVGWVPEASIVDGRDGEVLCHTLYPCWYSLCARLVVGYDKADLELTVVGNGRLTIDRRQLDLPHAKVVATHFMAVAVPAIEVANEVCSEGIGCPFAVDDGAVCSDIEAVLFISARELVQTAFGLFNLLDPVLSFGETGFEGSGIWLEPWVELDDALGEGGVSGWYRY